ncbi:MAG: hypothetical protein HYS57_00265 [Parcubacteria group bacterium]|nr:hypothetical protein [Parcubacteria group bacterium]
MKTPTKIGEEGQVLLVALLMLVAIFGIGMSLSVVFLNEVRLTRENLESVRAVYAADAALEWRLYRCFKNANAVAPSMTNNTSYTHSSSMSGGVTTFRTVGSSQRASQAVKRGLSADVPIPCL